MDPDWNGAPAPCRMRRALAVVAGSLLLGLGGCGEDSFPDPPVLEGRVVDAFGAPVQNARIGLIYDLDGTALDPTRSSRILSCAPSDTPQTCLGPISPNPFERQVRIRFDLASDARALLEILDGKGELVRTVLEKDASAGRHAVSWDSRDTNGVLVQNGVITARLSLLEEESYVIFGELRLFRIVLELADFLEAYRTSTDVDGRFSILLQDLPIGEEVRFVDIEGNDQGVRSVRPTVQVCAVDEAGGSLRRGCMDVELGDRSRSVSVDLTIDQHPAPTSTR